MISDNNPALLVALRQLFPDQAREIWVLVHGAGALVDQAALLEFAKRQSTPWRWRDVHKAFRRLSH